MTLFIETSEGEFSIWGGQLIDGLRHPPDIEQKWSAEELADKGLFSVVIPPIPPGKVADGYSVQRVDGVVSYVFNLVDAPGSVDAQFPPLQPWQFWSVIDLSGIGEQALYDAIDLIPDAEFKVKARRKLANPPGGVFKRSDPLFSNSFLMMQLSLSKEAIDALWTQGLAFT